MYAKETVICGGLPVVAGRRVHYGRIDPAGAREVFIREGLLGGGLVGRWRFLERLEEVRDEVGRRSRSCGGATGLWSDEAVFEFFDERVPQGMCTGKAFQRWREDTRRNC